MHSLQSLQPLFDALPRDLDGDEAVLTQPIVHWMREASRQERRVTFFGAYKSGKSTLVNALLGTPILPARQGRTPPVTAMIRYGEVPSIRLRRTENDDHPDEALPFDTGLGRLRSLPADVDEIAIAVPLPLLRNGCVCVDTPGLFDDERRTLRAMTALERADLAIMVLAADKILSAQERDIARWAAEVLCGNVVYIVNRMDSIDEDEREDVLEWARAALRTSGNNVVGQPRIIAAAAGGRSDCPGVEELRRWLSDLFSSPAGDTIAALSRLGVLRRRLGVAIEGLQPALTVARATTQRLRIEEEAALIRERAAVRSRIAQARVRVRAVPDVLDALGEAFVAACVENTQSVLKQSERDRGPTTLHVRPALGHYAESVRDKVGAALAGSPLTAPPFDLRGWSVAAGVEAAAHPAGEIAVTLGDLMTRPLDGGRAGREAASALSGWIGKNIFQINLEEETLKRIERVARGILPSLRHEAERYVERVLSLLDSADALYERWTRPAPHVDEAEAAERRALLLLEWCKATLQETEKLVTALVD